MTATKRPRIFLSVGPGTLPSQGGDRLDFTSYTARLSGKPPLTGRAAAEAQAMGRPVVANAVGSLPESLLSPPRMPEKLRTGWVARPGNAGELARAIGAALALDNLAYEAMSARARQFAEFMFSPQKVAEAIRGVYTSLLVRDV